MPPDASEFVETIRQSSPLGFTRRLARWVRGSWQDKLFSIKHRIVRYFSPVFVPLIRVFAKRSTLAFRSWHFDALAPLTDVLLSHHGDEKFLVLTYDKSVSKDLYVRGNAEFAKLVRAIDALGDTFQLHTLVDIGANIGTICIPAVKRGLAKKAIAFEPESRNFRALMANIWLNDLGRDIVAHNQALGSQRDQMLLMELSAGNSGDHRIHVGSASSPSDEAGRALIEVRSGRLDDALPELDSRKTLIFMDTQGYEGHVLAGAERVIQARVPIVLELWPYGIRRAESYEALLNAVARYDSYYDLSLENPAPQPTATIRALYEMTDSAGGYTDILLV